MRAATGWFLVALSIAPATARAEASRIATARELAIRGIELIENGDCERGLPLVEQAEELHHAVVHLQYLARCQARAGRLVAATELWRRILREPVPEGATPAVHAAAAEARSELATTLPRLARTTIEIRGRYEGLELLLDGTPIPTAAMKAEYVLDPGEHRLTANARSFEPSVFRWTLEEGGSERLTVRLNPASVATRETGTPIAHGDSTWTTVGWVAAATGSAALVAGTVTLLTRNNRRSNLRNQCPQGICSPPAVDRAEYVRETDAIERLTTASNLLFAAGSVLAATGVTLIVVGSGSKEPKPAQSAVKVHLYPGGVAATGSF